MSKLRLQKVAAAFLVALLLTSSLATLVSAGPPNAPTTQAVRSRQVKGLLPGGQFANIWLGLQPDTPSADVTVIAEWDRPDASSTGLGFWILDQNSLPRVGEEAFSTIATAAGSPSFILNGPSNMQGAGFKSAGPTPYTIVIYNDSNADANFTLTATNALITDDANKVTDPNAAVTTSTTVTGTVAAAPAASTVVTATATPAPVATTATTTTATTVVTTTTTTAPAATTATTTTTAATTTGEVRATTMQGDLPTQDSQHFLGLAPTQRDGEITLRLTFDPQDSTELARRLNFWVLDENGLTQFLRGTSPGELAIAAGNRTFLGESNERVASFKAVGLGTYTVIVYNNSSVPGSYTLTVEGGILSDGSQQTKTAQAAPVGATGTATTTTIATTSAVTATTAVTGTTPAAAPATGTTAAREGQPGGTYTVKSGDTVALIARDLYGDYRLYQQICTFNGITNCDLIEVGDVIRLPTTAQIQSGATAPAAAAAPAATPTRAAQPAASTAVTTTAAVTTTTPVTRSTAVTTTRPVTTTQPATTTRTTTSTTASATPRTTASTATTSTATTSTGTIVDDLVADGRFTSLVEALQATGLDSVLRGAGPFTVFAPTDAAFAALPPGAFEQLLDDPSGQLTEILRYHVVTGNTLSEDLSNNMQATTTQGKTVRFEGQGTAWKINGANMIERDIDASNGVIHVIDAVILPPPE